MQLATVAGHAKARRSTVDIRQMVQAVTNSYMECNPYFRVALMTNGVTLFEEPLKRRRYQKVLNFAFLVANFVSNIYRIVLNVILITVGLSVYRDLLFITMAVCGLAGHFQLIRNRTLISQTIRQLLLSLDPKKREKLNSVQAFYAALMAVGTGSEVLRRCLLWFGEGTAKYVSRVNMHPPEAHFWLHVFCGFDILSQSHFTYGWLVHTMVIYAFVFKLSLAADVTFYDRSCDEVHRVVTKGNEAIMRTLKIIRRKRHELSTLKKNIVDLLSMFPLLWFSSLFVETTMRLVHFTKSFHNVTLYFICIKWSSYVVCLMFVVWVTVLVEDIVASEANRAYALTNALNKVNSLNWDVQAETLGLVMELGNFQGQRPSAWGLFDLRKSVILNFIGTAIPFSVMINEFVAVAKH